MSFANPAKGGSPPKRRVAPKISHETWVAYAFLLPSLIGFVVFYAIPAGRGFYISLTDWDLLTDPNFIGAENYRDLMSDRAFRGAMWRTLKYVILNIPLQTVIATVIAAMMDRLTKSTTVRGILLFPWLMPNVIVALLFLWLLDPTLGVVNAFTDWIGLGRFGFFGNPNQALEAIVGVNIWRHVGYTALLIFAGLQTIPKSLYEAASIDGATEFQSFFRITVPLLRPVLAFVMVTSVIGSFQLFDTVAVATGGGPINATEVINWLIYERAFERFDMGYATAVSMVLFVILVMVSLIQMRLFRADESDL